MSDSEDTDGSLQPLTSYCSTEQQQEKKGIQSIFVIEI